MKTIVNIELENNELVLLADILDGKETKRTAMRAEIVELCQGFIRGMLDQAQSKAPAPVKQEAPKPQRVTTTNPLYTIDPEDREHLQGKSPGYVIGWNKVKYSKKF